MLKDLMLGVIIAGVVVGGGMGFGVLPITGEPIEIPWRMLLVMVITFVIGVSAGFAWLQRAKSSSSFPWPVLATMFTFGAMCAVDVTYALENNLDSVYTVPVLAFGGVSVGTLVGAIVKSTG